MTGRVRHVILQHRPFVEVLTFQDAALGTAHVTVLAAFATLLLWQDHAALRKCCSIR